MSTERRPRIPAELSARIDKLRGAGEGWETPYEGYVRWLLGEAVEARELRDGGASCADWIWHHIRDWDEGWDAIESAFDEVRERIQKERDEDAFEEEHVDEEGFMDQAAFDRYYPTPEDKRRYHEQQAKALAEMQRRHS